MTNLRDLWLSGASGLSGSLPPQWSALSGLTSLSLEGLGLSGGISSQVAALRGALVDLSLDGNLLSGPMSAMASLTGLTALDLGRNR